MVVPGTERELPGELPAPFSGEPGPAPEILLQVNARELLPFPLISDHGRPALFEPMLTFAVFPSQECTGLQPRPPDTVPHAGVRPGVHSLRPRAGQYLLPDHPHRSIWKKCTRSSSGFTLEYNILVSCQAPVV